MMITSFGQLIVRSPLFPICYMEEIDYENPLFREALMVASPQLYKQLSVDEKYSSKIEISLYKYWSRMCWRSTPFGLFSSCSIAEIGDKTDIELVPLNFIERKCRLDMSCFFELVEKLENDERVKQQLRYFPNDTLYRIWDKARYIDYKHRRTRREHRIVEIECSEELDRILYLSENGCRIDILAQAICSKEIEYEEAFSYVQQLVKEKILVSEISVSMTGDDPLERLYYWISGSRDTGDLKTRIEKLREEVQSIETHGLTEQSIQVIQSNLSSFGIEPPINTVQIDTYRDCSNASFSSENIKEIQRLLECLWRLGQYGQKQNDTIDSFAKSFYERYDTQPMSFLLVMDEDLGMGYPLKKDNVQRPGLENSPMVILSEVERMVLKKYVDALENKQECKVIELSESDFVKLVSPKTSPTIDTVAVLCSLCEDGGDIWVEIKSVVPGAARLMGRFCHLNSKVMNLAGDIAMCEEKKMTPDTLQAEIVHTPDTRVGNIVHRPVLRSVEITYLSSSGAARNRQIPSSDLILQFDKGKLRIRSKKLGKYIEPVLTNAHNYALHSTPTYKFLCDYQSYGKTTIRLPSFDNLLGICKHLPRIVYGRCILLPESWILESEDEGIARVSFDKVLMKNTLPKEIFIIEGDNKLFLNLGTKEGCTILEKSLHTKRRITVQEVLHPSVMHGVHSNDGYHNAEYLIPFRIR